MIAKAALILAAVWLCAVPTLFAQTEYTTDGNPTALEEEIRWLVNRGRFNTARENDTRSTTYTDVPASAPPLAPHHAITLASRHHSEDMARNNLFQHATIPGSAYYDPVTQPDPWDRMRAEGYNFNSAAENIAAGYGTAQAAYVGWWKSEGHRRNMYNLNHREIGNGYFFWNSSTYRHYYTMDLGRAASTHFFTDTLFHDADNDGAYDQNEGRSGLHILLRINGTTHTQFDLSSPAGSFAIPIQTIPDGALVQVFLANPTTTTASLSLPRNYDDYSQVTLGPGQEVLAGSFVQPNSTINLGFRNLTPPTPPLAPPVLASAIDAGRIQLRWNSQTSAQYQVLWTQDWLNWTTLDTGPLPGTGGELTVFDTLPPQHPTTRFYRVAVQ